MFNATAANGEGPVHSNLDQESQERLDASGLNTILVPVFSLTEVICAERLQVKMRFFVAREHAAAVDPHRLAALAGAVVRHAGGAPGRSCDLAALDPVCLRSNDTFVGALLSHCWRCE
jgi:hypothetical protein